MSLTEVTVEGTLRDDGTVALDEKPNLAPGRVTVVLRQEAGVPAPNAGWLQFMLDARKQMEAAGCYFMDEAEMKAHIEWMREGDRIDDMLRETDEPSAGRGRPAC